MNTNYSVDGQLNKYIGGHTRNAVSRGRLTNDGPLIQPLT